MSDDEGDDEHAVEPLDRSKLYDVVVIGAGAAGIGAAVACDHADIEEVIVIDRHKVGKNVNMDGLSVSGDGG